MTLRARSAIVTGGNSGIGKAVVLALAEAGANIVIDYVANRRRPRSSRSRSPRSATRPSASRPTSARSRTCRRLVDAAVKAFGRLDIMVNNAGIETRTSVLDTTEEQYERVMDDQPEERVLRHADRRQADDRAGRRRPDHQHHLGPRGLADARQHPVLPVQGRHADAHPHRRRRARRRTASRSSASGPARSPRRSTPRR